MVKETAMTKNLRRFLAAVRDLQDRSPGIEGMGLVWGLPGEGKSTAITFTTNTVDGIYINVLRDWSPVSLLGALMIELGMDPLRIRAQMVDFIVKKLMEQPRPIFVDEAQRLSEHMMGSLRDVYDLTGCPLMLIGDERLARNTQTRGRFARRITQWIEFRGIDLDDTRAVAAETCEVAVADDLLAHLHQAARANVGRVTSGLAAIEKFGKSNGLDTVSMADWGDRQLFFDQPKFRRGR